MAYSRFGAWSKACWSTTILASNGLVSGTFAINWREPRSPTEKDQEIIEQVTHLAAVAIEPKGNEAALTKAFEEIAKSEAELRTIWWAHEETRRRIQSSLRGRGRKSLLRSDRNPQHASGLNALVLVEFGRFNSGDVKGTIADAARYHFAPNDVRRHRLISTSHISLLPCHGTA
jgi:hypothetical protein